MSRLYPAFLKLAGRPVLLVGGGSVAAGKLRGLLDAGAQVTVVAPAVLGEIAGKPVTVRQRPFTQADLDGMWFVVAAAPADVNREVTAAAEQRCVFVNAVDDPASGSAYAAGVLERGGVTVAVSTDGRAPALTGLLREGLQALLPDDLGTWREAAEKLRAKQQQAQVPMSQRRPLLLEALNDLYRKGVA